MKLFSVYDAKAKIYNQPFYSRSTADAIRGFQKQAQTKESMIGSYPEDYILHDLADWDEEKGQITPHNVPIAVARATEFTISD